MRSRRCCFARPRWPPGLVRTGAGRWSGGSGRSWSLYARSEYGRVFLHVNATDAGDRPRRLSATWPLDLNWSTLGRVGWWERGGFGYAVGGTPGGNAIRQLAIPYWSLALLAALPPAALAIRRWRHRPAADHCPACGYDLRATPWQTRTPACGGRRTSRQVLEGERKQWPWD